MRKKLISVVLFLLALSFLITRGFTNTGSAGTSPVRSLWVGEEQTAIAVSLADGQPRLYISTEDLEDIAVDNSRGVVWVGTKKEIIQYNFDGTENMRHPIGQNTSARTYDKQKSGNDAKKAMVTIKNKTSSATSQDATDVVRISLDPFEGSLWVGVGSEVIKLSSDNRELFRMAGFDHVIDVSVDISDGSCWVAEKHKIRKYSSDGTALFNITIDEYIFITVLAADPVSHSLWVGTEQGLGKINALGQELFRTAGPVGIRDMEVNSATGSLLLVTNKYVYKYGKDNQQLLMVPLCPDTQQTEAIALKSNGINTTAAVASENTMQNTTCGAEFTAIAVDSVDNTIWVATTNTLYKGSDAGDILLQVPGFINIKALDIGLPEIGITITEPMEGAIFTASPIIVKGIITDPTATVDVNGTKATVTGLDFEAKNILLSSGTNTITATATNLARQKATDTIHVTYNPPSSGPSLLLCPEPYGEQRPHQPIPGCSQQVLIGRVHWNRGYVLGLVDESVETVVVDGITMMPGAFIYNQGRIANGMWTGTYFWALLVMPGSNGPYPINVVVADSEGKTVSATVTFIKDMVYPNVMITAPPDGTITREQTITVTGVVDDPTAVVRLDQTGANIPVVNGTFTTQYDMGSVDGPQYIYISATDPAMNQSSAFVTVIRDATPPQINVTSPADGAITNSQTISITGTIVDQNPGTITVSANSGPAQPLTLSGTGFSNTITIVNGANSLLFTATDRVGNTSTLSRVVTLDQEPPTVVVIGIDPNAVLTGTATITVNATDVLSGIQSVTLLVDGIIKTTLTQPPYTFNLETFGLTAGNHTITIRVLDRAGNQTEQNIPVTVQHQFGIQITSPGTGAIINKSTAIIRGTITLPANQEIGVAVNGTPAEQQGTNFAAIVPLQQGQNTITATATNVYGIQEQASITINTDTMQEQMRFTVNPTSGITMSKTDGTIAFDTTMNVETYITGTIASYAWDTNGDGTSDQAGATLTQITASYQTPGLYFPTVTVTDTMGNTYTDTTIVNVLDRNTINALLKAKWEGMKIALASGNVEGAVGYFIPGVRERYKNTFTLLQSTISTIASNMPPVELIYVTEKIAKYRVRRDQVFNGQMETITYYIYFSKNQNGMWQIEQF
jgi:hypothetical protein